MKKQPVMIIGGMLGILFVLLAFLFPIGPGLIQSGEGVYNVYPGYDFILTNDANMGLTTEASSAMIAAFVLLIIGAVFAFLATLLPLTGSTKFAGFLDVVGGLCLAATGVIYILANILIETPGNNTTWALGYGFMVAAVASLIAALTYITLGVIGMSNKK